MNVRVSDEAVYERARLIINDQMYAIDLQCRRIRAKESEEDNFFRVWQDFRYLISSLREIRRGAELASTIPRLKVRVCVIIDKYDFGIPDLIKMRNVGEHLDEYALDRPTRRYNEVHRGMLHVGSFDGTTFDWLDCKLNIDAAFKAAAELHKEIKELSTLF